MFDPQNIPQLQVLRDAVSSGNLVPLIGAGISQQASLDFPNWRTLLQDMKTEAISHGWFPSLEEAQIDELLSQNQFLTAAQDLRYRYPTDAYNRFLIGKFDPPGAAPAEIHNAIFALKPPLILTTSSKMLMPLNLGAVPLFRPMQMLRRWRTTCTRLLCPEPRTSLRFMALSRILLA